MQSIGKIDKRSCIVHEASVDSTIPIILCGRNLVAISTLYIVGGVWSLTYIMDFSYSTEFLRNLAHKDRVIDLASKKATVIFTNSSCCMCVNVKALFYELGASPAIHELDQDSNRREMELELQQLGCSPTALAIFVGGKYVGSAKDVRSFHVDGSLKEKLIAARAMWL
ncbi:glutaredoxin-C11-like [Apium graveolens]|uniref:glutaredoxin-C11-like n=1 Tax=Apium graveolens TaxID=4045 RepID=UPI003D78EB27